MLTIRMRSVWCAAIIVAVCFASGCRTTGDVLERARVAAGASVARFLKPNQPITMEWLNLGLDDHNIVRSVRCG